MRKTLASLLLSTTLLSACNQKSTDSAHRVYSQEQGSATGADSGGAASDPWAAPGRAAENREMPSEKAKSSAPPPMTSVMPSPSKAGTGTGLGYGVGGGRGRGMRGAADMRGDAVTTESYTDYGRNGWVDSAKDHLSTFAADVDTASYTLARRKLLEGTMPVAAGVRVEEFVNYFSYAFPAPAN
ncbi:MAG: von Willebrand factor type A domain-containing protein, partial [Kofleriaceae bacterium]